MVFIAPKLFGITVPEAALAGAVLAATLCSCSNVTTQPSANNTQVSFTKANVASNYIKGADISELLEMEQKGIVYKDQNGVATDALKILKDNGVNYVRIRLWNDPKDANGKEYGAGFVHGENTAGLQGMDCYRQGKLLFLNNK